MEFPESTLIINTYHSAIMVRFGYYYIIYKDFFCFRYFELLLLPQILSLTIPKLYCKKCTFVLLKIEA